MQLKRQYIFQKQSNLYTLTAKSLLTCGQAFCRLWSLLFLVAIISLWAPQKVSGQQAFQSTCISASVDNFGNTATIKWQPIGFGANFFNRFVCFVNDSSRLISSNFNRHDSSFTLTDTQLVVSGLNPGMNYAYIAYIDTGGKIICVSNEVNFFVDVVSWLESPKAISFFLDTTKVDIVWNKFSDSAKFGNYVVYYDSIPGALSQTDTLYNITDTSFSLFQQSSNLPIYFQVATIDTAAALIWRSSEQLTTLQFISRISPPQLNHTIAGNNITLSWPPTPYPAFSSYIIQEATGNQSFVNRIEMPAGKPFDTTYTFNGLNSGLSYSYTVISRNLVGNLSTPLDTVSIVLIDSVAPPVPTGFKATPQTNAVKLQWNRNADPDGDFWKYNIYFDTIPNPTTFLFSNNSINDTTFTVTSLNNGTTYYGRITSEDFSNNESAFTTQDSATPGDFTPPLPVDNFTASIDSARTDLSWTQNYNIDGDFAFYVLYGGRVLNNLSVIDTIYNITTTSYRVNNLANNVVYFYELASFDTLLNTTADQPRVMVRPTAVERESNNSFSVSNFLDSGKVAQIDNNLDIDYFYFDLPQVAEVNIETNAVPSLDSAIGNNIGNTNMTLYGSLGTNQIAFNDNNPSNPNYSRINRVLNPGRYYVRIAGANFNTTGYYSINLTKLLPDFLEPNNSIFTATQLQDTQLISNLSIFPSGDIDVFRFEGKTNHTADVRFIIPFFTGTIRIKDSLDNTLQTHFGNNNQFIVPYDGPFFIDYRLNNFVSPSYSLDFKLIPPISYADTIVINELRYGNTNNQYIELYNVSKNYIPAGKFEIPRIGFVFPDGFMFPPEAYLVIAKDSSTFYNAYGFYPDFSWGATTTLGNTENIVLRDSLSGLVDVVHYRQVTGFPIVSDTLNSMELFDNKVSRSLGNNWYMSHFEGGTPGHKNSIPQVYAEDGFNPDNSIAQATYFENAINDTFSLSELHDTVDFVLLRMRAGDTLEISMSALDTNLTMSIGVYDKQGQYILGETQTALSQFYQFVAPAEDTFYLKFGLLDNMEQFVLNEGFFVIQSNLKRRPILSPWLEDFETTLAGLIPAGWNRINADGNNRQWNVSPLTIGLNNTKGLQLASNALGNDDWVITPAIRILPDDQLSFFSRASSTNFPETMEIWLGDRNASTIAEFHTRIDSLVIDTTGFKEYVLDLDTFRNNVYRIAFRNTSINQNIQYLDNISVSLPFFEAVVKGRVTDFLTGLPIDGARAFLNSNQTFSNANGDYFLDDINYGTQFINFQANGYSQTKFSVNISQGDTLTVDIQLYPLIQDTIFYTAFNSGDPKGFASQSAMPWTIKSQLIYGGDTILPVEGDSVIAIFDSTNYLPSQSSLWRLTGLAGFNFRPYQEIALDFKYYADLDSSDRVYLIGNETFFIDLNGDGTPNSADFFTGRSQQWTTQNVDLTYLRNFSSMDISFVFQSDSFQNNGFGVALDDIFLSGLRSIIPAKPYDLSGLDYINNVATLNWKPDSAQIPTAYKIYKKSVNALDFTLIASTTDTFFLDSAVTNLEFYNYKVTAVYPYGESDFSNEILVKVGVPVVSFLPHIEEFNQAGNVPLNWSFDLSPFDVWKVGNRQAAETFNNTFNLPGTFAYTNFFEIGLLAVPFESALTSPWFDLSASNDRIVVSFDKFGPSAGEYHIFAIKDSLSSDWTHIDTLPGSFQLQSYRYDLTDLLAGKPFVQIGFIFKTDPNRLQVNNQGFAIDNFYFLDIQRGVLTGEILSQANLPLKDLTFNLSIDDSLGNWNVPTSYSLKTDSMGRFSTDSIIIYRGPSYQFDIDAWGYQSKSVKNITIDQTDTVFTPIVMDFKSTPAIKLALDLDSLGNPNLNWESANLIGELRYDDGNLSFTDSLQTNNALGLRMRTEASLPAKIAQLAIFTNGNTSQTYQIDALALKVNASGFPNFTDTIFYKQQISFQINNNNDWNFVNLNESVDTSDFVLLLFNSGSSLGIGYSDNNSGLRSLVSSGSQNVSYIPSTMMMRAYFFVNGGPSSYTTVNFGGDYELYRFEQATSLDSLLTKTNNNSFQDTSLQIGDNVIYYVLARDTFGVSDTSNQLVFIKRGIPFLKHISYNRKVNFDFGIASGFGSIPFGNSGGDTLAFQLNYKVGFAPNHPIDTPDVVLQGLGSNALYYESAVNIGDTTLMKFYLENINLQGEAIKEMRLFFPPGFFLLNANNLRVDGSNRFLLSNNANGDSVTLVFSDPNVSSSGEINPFEFASSELLVYLDSSFTDSIAFVDYVITGDQGNKKSGKLYFGQQLVGVSLALQSGILPAGVDFSVNFIKTINRFLKTGAKQPGYFELATNAPQRGMVKLPYDIYTKPAYGSLTGLIADEISNNPIVGATVTTNEINLTSNAQGIYLFDSLNTGEYLVSVSAPNYRNFSQAVLLANHQDTVVRSFNLTPDVLKPENLTAQIEANRIALKWNIQKHLIFFDFDEAIIGNPIVDWKVVDLDADGRSWEYYGIGPFSGKASLSVMTNDSFPNNDWLISKQLRIEKPNARLKFVASPQDLVLNEEEFRVWVSTTRDDPSDFTDTLLTYKFPIGNSNWQSFNLNLGQYSGDSIFIAFQCISDGQFRLKIDNIEFENTQFTDAPADSGIYHYKIYREVNLGTAALLDSIVVSGDTVNYTDSSIVLDTLYTYFVRSFIPNTGIVSEATNLATNRLLSNDIGITALLSPATGRNLTNSEPVEVRIRNFGADSLQLQDSITLAFSFQGTTFEEKILPLTPIPPSGIYDHTFANFINLEAKGSYTITAWCSVKNDINNFNDTLTTTVNHLPDTVIPPAWSVNPAQFQFNMSVTAEVFIIDTLTTDTNDILAAYSGNQLRGVAKIQFLPNFNRYVALLTVFSNVSIENITFKIWDASRDSIFPINESLTFINNQIYGTLLNPIKLTTPSNNQNYDVSLKAIRSPLANLSAYSNAEQLTVTLENVGTIPIMTGDSMVLGYMLLKDGQQVQMEEETLLLSAVFDFGDSLNYTFSATLDLEDTAVYDIQTYLYYPTDFNPTNDTSALQIINRISGSPPTWSVNPAAYQFSAFITARVLINDVLSRNENDIVAAFINNEVRGVANVQFVPNFNEWVVQMAIYDNTSSGNQIRFMVYDANRAKTLHVENRFTFAANTNYGNLVNPERLFASDDANGIEILSDNTYKIFPNPAYDDLWISKKEEDDGWAIIYDGLGRKITSTRLTSNINHLDLSKLAKGVYQVQILSENNNLLHVQKLIVK